MFSIHLQNAAKNRVPKNQAGPSLGSGLISCLANSLPAVPCQSWGLPYTEPPWSLVVMKYTRLFLLDEELFAWMTCRNRSWPATIF